MDLLRNLSETLGVSGHEGPVRERICGLVEALANEVFTDALGNLFTARRGRSERTVMPDTHMDEVGLVASHVDGAGFLRFGLVGAYDERILAGFRMRHRSVIANRNIVCAMEHTARDRGIPRSLCLEGRTPVPFTSRGPCAPVRGLDSLRPNSSPLPGDEFGGLPEGPGPCRGAGRGRAGFSRRGGGIVTRGRAIR